MRGTRKRYHYCMAIAIYPPKKEVLLLGGFWLAALLLLLDG